MRGRPFVVLTAAIMFLESRRPRTTRHVQLYSSFPFARGLALWMPLGEP